MPYDPETFENLYPFPNKEAIFLCVQKQVLEGELHVPKEHLMDTKGWIADKAKEICKHEYHLWLSSECESQQAWAKAQEVEFGFDNLPENLKQNIHNFARENASDRGGMLNLYDEVSRLVIDAYEIGVREHLQRNHDQLPLSP